MEIKDFSDVDGAWEAFIAYNSKLAEDGEIIKAVFLAGYTCALVNSINDPLHMIEQLKRVRELAKEFTPS